MHAIYIQTKRRVVHVLWDVDLANPTHLPNLCGQVLCDAINLVQIGTAHLNVDRSRHARVQNGVDHRAAGKESANIGKLFGHSLLHAVHIFETAQPALLIQLHLDRRSIRTRVRCIERGEIRNNTDVGDDPPQIIPFHRAPDQIFDFADILVGHFDASAGGDLQVDGELAGIGLGKKRQPEQRIDQQAGQE